MTELVMIRRVLVLFSEWGGGADDLRQALRARLAELTTAEAESVARPILMGARVGELMDRGRLTMTDVKMMRKVLEYFDGGVSLLAIEDLNELRIVLRAYVVKLEAAERKGEPSERVVVPPAIGVRLCGLEESLAKAVNRIRTVETIQDDRLKDWQRLDLRVDKLEAKGG